MKKILTLLPLCLLFFSVTTIAQDFHLDPSFGQNGVTEYFKSSDLSMYKMVSQDDGKIVVGGSFQGVYAVMRLNRNGSFDSTFGANGKAITRFPVLKNSSNVQATSTGAGVYAITLQRDGKVVGAGRITYSGGFNGPAFAVSRYNKDGTPDQSFGDSGRVVTFFKRNNNDADLLNATLQSVIELKTGQLLAVGIVEQFDLSFSRYLFYGYGVVVYNKDGTIAYQSLTNIPYQLAPVPPNNNNSYATLKATAMLSDGKIIATGSVQYKNFGRGLLLVRFNADGTPDNSFGDNGIVMTFLPSKDSYGQAVAVQSDGKIVVTSDEPGLIVFRYNADGTPDNAFGNGGLATTEFLYPNSTTPYRVFGNSVAVQADGKIVVTGRALRNTLDLAVVRYNTDGSLDNSFGKDGKIVTNEANLYFVNSLISTDRIYLTGLKNNNNSLNALAAFLYSSNVCTPPTFLNNGTIVLDASCFGNDGNISIIPLSGTAPFKYSIDGGATYVDGSDKGYTFMGLAAGQYQLRLKDANGCESAIVTREVKPNMYGPCATLSVKSPSLRSSIENSAAFVHTYPNPSSGQFKVQLQGFASTKVQLQVLDPRGSVVQSRILNVNEGSSIDVNLQGKAKGLYFVRVISDKGVQVQKVTVQ